MSGMMSESEDGFLTALSEAEEEGGKGGRRSSVVKNGAETETEEQGGSGGGASDEETETEEEEKDGKQENVVVCLRVRPSKSTSPSEIYALAPSSSTLTLLPFHPSRAKRGGGSGRSEEYDFRFDLLHTAPSPTSELYDRKIRPVVRSALGGFNGTVFAYGQTASGKTHTMMGSPSEPGIIPLAIDELFEGIHKQNTHRTYSLRVSFLEIYNEQLRDLLSPPSSTSAPQKPPEIVESGLVKNLTERAVSLPSEVLEVLKEGEQRRRVGATDWNERSSRSHCVFIVTIESMTKSASGGDSRTSKLNLIDLAGSESATGQEDRRKEGSFINRSLLTLGTVIAKLTDASSSTAHIPYRDSKLTRLLQPALSGNSRVAVVCTVSPDAEQATETLSTLKFARRAKQVVTRAERNVILTPALQLAAYASQVEQLKAQIAAVESGEAARIEQEKREREFEALKGDREKARERAEEAERKGREAQSALTAQAAELARLRAQLAQTQSLILTGPSLEATARRVSGSYAPDVLSPSRSRSLSGMHGKKAMEGLGLGRPDGLRKVGPEEGGRTISGLERLVEEGEGEKETLRASLLDAQSSLATAESELSTLRAQLSQLQRSTSLAQLDAEKSAAAAEDRKGRVRELEREVAELKSRVEEVEKERDALKKELEALKAQGATAAATLGEKDAALAALQARVEEEAAASSSREAALRAELRLAHTASTEAAAHAAKLTDLADLASRTSQQELLAATQPLEARVRALEGEKEGLRRQIERFEALERQRQGYAQAQRQGTDALKSRLAELQARTSSAAAGSLSRSTSSASSRSSSTSAAEVVLQQRIDELESQLMSRREGEERRERQQRRELQERVQQERAEAERERERGEGWKQKYLAAQRLIDQLTASGGQNLPPSSSSQSSLTPRKPSLRGPLSSSQSQSPARPPLPSPQPSSASLSSSYSTANWSKPTPPPLPYSPQQQSSREARDARKGRRETIAKDLARLKGAKVVDQRREGWDSPGASPVKGAFGDATGRGKKGSWESQA
ncbi:Kinesin-like protein kip2 [Rhodosporidiobolus nylandii]